MEIDQNLTSIKKHSNQEMTNFYLSPSTQTPLDDQLQQLQLLSQQEVIQRLKQKKQQILKQSQQVTKNCHQYFIDLSSSLYQIQSKTKKQIDKQTLDFLQKIQKRIQDIYDNQHSYNCSSQAYHTLKILLNNFVQTQQTIDQVKKILTKCYTISLQGGLVEYGSDMVMSTNKIYLNQSEFNTTNKKIHGNTLQVSERQFELVLGKFQQREEKLMITNQRLKNKVKSLQQVLSKKGLNIKEFNRMNSAQNEKCSFSYWDLELQRIKGQNSILKEEIGNISNKLITMVSENEGLKNSYKKMLQSNISQSNPNITISHSYQVLNNFDEQSRLMGNQQSKLFVNEQSRLIPNEGCQMVENESQQIVCSEIVIRENKQQLQGPSGIYLNSNIRNVQSHIHNEMLIEYEKKNQQLTLELTKKLKEIQQLTEQLNAHQNTISQMKEEQQIKQSELQKLTNHLNTLEHDYDISSKKRFQLEDKITLLKQTLKQKDEKIKSLLSQNQQHQYRIDNLQSMLKIKDQTISSLSQEIQTKLKSQNDKKIQQLSQQNQSQIQQMTTANQMLNKQMVICRNLLTQTRQQSQTKIANFKQQFKNLHHTIQSQNQQLAILKSQLYNLNKTTQQNQTTKKDQNSLTFKQKYQNNKKELSKIKKELKQKTKQYDTLKTDYDKINQLLTLKSIQINSKIQFITKEVEKSKTIYETKIKLFQEKEKILNQKFSYNLSEIASINQTKKSNFIPTIQRYIEALNNFSAKNAQLKKLKQQIRQLKSNKLPSNKGSKKEILKDIDSITSSLQHNTDQIISIQKALFQDRLKIQKKIAQQKLLIYIQENQLLKSKLNSQQMENKQSQQMINKLKKQVKKEQSLKNQSNQQQRNNQITILQQKIQKLQTQLKSSKNLYKKSQEELNSLQNELKKKKDHISNVKKELTSNSDQVDQLNLTIKNKNDQIDKLKRQLKDQSTKETLMNQMKQKMDDYSKLEQTNEELKKQLERANTSSRFQLSKLQNEIKQLKAQKRQQLNQKVNTKTAQLNQQLADLKSKNKKLKGELQRKESILQNLKSKAENQMKQIQAQLQQLTKEYSKKNKQIQSYQKKLQIATINQRKYKQKCKLFTVILQKLYTKIIKSDKLKSTKYFSTANKQETTPSILKNTSPITRAFSSNVFNSTTPFLNKQNENATLETLAEVDINLQDLDKYSEGLQMFGVNPFELKNLQTGLYNTDNQNSAFSHYMTSPQKKTQKSPQKNVKFNQNIQSEQNLEKLLYCLSDKEELNVNKVLSIFDEVMENSY